MNMSERLKNRRKELNLTMFEVAQKVGVSEATVSRWESGNIANMRRDKIEKIADALNVSPGYLMGWEAINPSNVVIGTELKKIILSIAERLHVSYEYLVEVYLNERASSLESKKLNEENLYNFFCKILERTLVTPSNIYPVKGLVSFEEIGTVKAGYNGMADETPTGKIVDIPAAMLNGRPKEDFFMLRVNGDSMYPTLVDGDSILVQRCTSVDSGTLSVVLYNGDEASVKKVNYASGEDWMELIPINPEYKTKRIEGSDLEQCRVLGKVVKLIREF